MGPSPYGRVPWRLLASGVYEAVLAAGEVDAELPDGTEWDRLDQLMARHATRATAQVMYASTVAAINTERERNWINGGAE